MLSALPPSLYSLRRLPRGTSAHRCESSLGWRLLSGATCLLRGYTCWKCICPTHARHPPPEYCMSPGIGAVRSFPTRLFAKSEWLRAPSDCMYTAHHYVICCIQAGIEVLGFGTDLEHHSGVFWLSFFASAAGGIPFT